MKKLTTAEEQVMHILWRIKKGFIKEILKEMPIPHPAYNTVSTIVRILEKKAFIGFKAYGKTHEYFPLVTKPEYAKSHMKGFMKDYFANSFQNMVSFLAKEEDLSIEKIEEILDLIKEDLSSSTNTKSDE